MELSLSLVPRAALLPDTVSSRQGSRDWPHFNTTAHWSVHKLNIARDQPHTLPRTSRSYLIDKNAWSDPLLLTTYV